MTTDPLDLILERAVERGAQLVADKLADRLMAEAGRELGRGNVGTAAGFTTAACMARDAADLFREEEPGLRVVSD